MCKVLKYQSYLSILKEELVPAMGCTEPIAIAYCATIMRDTLGVIPTSVDIYVSANILKNVKSVTVPNTDGMHGIDVAAAIGIVAGNKDKKLEVIANVTNEDINKVKNELIESMSSDFNTANAITSIFNMTKLVNTYVRNPNIEANVLMQALKCLYELLWVLGINVDIIPLTVEEKELVNSWNKAKKEKNFELADKLRMEIQQRNITL